MPAHNVSVRPRLRPVEFMLRPRLLFIVLPLIVAAVLVPRALGRGPTSVSWDIVTAAGPPDSVIRAPANQHLPPTAPPFYGDFWAGIHPVYPVGQSSGDSVGTFYFLAVATALPPAFEAASTHIYGMARLEIVGEGSLDMSGTVRLGGESYMSLSGGTGAFAGVDGECVLETLSATLGQARCRFE